MIDQTSFLGKGWGFPPTFSKATKTVSMSEEEQDIQESLHILLTTRVGERVMLPKYGCNMDRLLFEPLNTTLQTYMEDLVKTAILYFEPRIKLNKITLTPIAEEGRIEIEVDYTIKTTNSRFNFVYPFYLVEGINQRP
ncbi:MAG: GPW/gp25 family protein [Bacteroidota bacterium]